MVPKNKSPLVILLFSFCSLILLCSSEPELKETNLTVYMQDYPARLGATPGPNATVVPLTGIPGSLWKYDSFGTITVADDPVTEGPSSSSAEIGRSQGFYVTASLDGSRVTFFLSFVFTNWEYNGSTLLVAGSSLYADAVRESSITGGTGKFRNARGTSFFRTVYLDVKTTSYNVIQCSFSFQHYS